MIVATRNIARTLSLLQGRGWVSSPEIARSVGSSRQAMVRVYARLLREGLLVRSQTRPVCYRIAPDLGMAQRREISRLVGDARVLAA